MTIEVNGKQYEEIVHEKHKSHTGKGSLIQAMIMASAFTIHNPYGEYAPRQKELPIPSHKLEEEFEKIQNKKSLLSKSQRDHVVKVFLKKYRPI